MAQGDEVASATTATASMTTSVAEDSEASVRCKRTLLAVAVGVAVLAAVTTRRQ